VPPVEGPFSSSRGSVFLLGNYAPLSLEAIFSRIIERDALPDDMVRRASSS
jgi:hypothetical protein